MGQDVRLLRAGSADIERAADLFLAARDGVRVAGVSSAADDAVLRRWVRKCVIYDEFWIAERGRNELVGILSLGTDSLEILAVTPQSRREGIGTLLLEQAKQQRPLGLQTRVPDGAAAGLAFLLHHGFERADQQPGAPKLPAKCLRWRQTADSPA